MAERNILKVGLVQQSCSSDRVRNLQESIRGIHTAAERGAKLVLLQELQNLVNLLGIPSSLNFAVMGSVILIGVLADTQFAEFRKRRSMATRRPAPHSPA